MTKPIGRTSGFLRSLLALHILASLLVAGVSWYDYHAVVNFPPDANLEDLDSMQSGRIGPTAETVQFLSASCPLQQIRPKKRR